MAERKIQTGAYHGAGGPSAARTMGEVSIKLLTEERLAEPLGTVDQLVANQVRNAFRQKRNGITVLDLGSGEGQLLHDMIDYPEQMPQTVLALQEVKAANVADFTITIVGLTDTSGIAQRPSVNGTVYTSQSAHIPQGIHYPTAATNFGYAIVNGQSLRQFLEINNIGNVDLVLATETMMYLKPHLFQSTLTDIADALTPGGRCVITGYKHFGGDSLSISDLSKQTMIPGSLEALQEKAIDLEFSGMYESEEAEVLYEKLLDKWVRLANLAVDTYDQMQKAKRAMRDSGSYEFLLEYLDKIDHGQRPSLHDLAQVYVVELQRLLNDFAGVYVREAKERIVTQFTHEYVGRRRVEVGNYMISITNIEAA